MTHHDPGIVALAKDPRVPWATIQRHELPSPNEPSYRAAVLQHGLDSMRITTVCASLHRYLRSVVDGIVEQCRSSWPHYSPWAFVLDVLRDEIGPEWGTHDIVRLMGWLRNAELLDGELDVTPLGQAVRLELERRTA